MSTRRRRPSVVNNTAVYDPVNHGTVDAGTGIFRPNINGHATMSQVDQEAEARGTHAAPASEAWRAAFPNSTLNRVAASVENPPAMNNDRGQAAAESLPQTRQVRAVNPAPVTGPNGNARTDAANLAQNRALYSADGTVAPTGAAAPAVAMAARNAPRKLDLQSNAVQSALDKVIGYEGHAANQTATSAPTQYGSGSVRFANGAGMDQVQPAQPIVENGAQTGVGRAAFDPTAARIALKRDYPEVYKEGTPENKAFAAHVAEHGEQSAHENLATIMKPFQIGPPAPTPSDKAAMDYAQSRIQPGLLPGAPKPGKAIAKAARNNADTGGPGAVIDPNSTLGKVAGFLTPSAPTPPETGNPGILSRIASNVGITDAGQAAIGAGLRGTANAAIALARPAAATPTAPAPTTTPQAQPPATAPAVASIQPRTNDDR